MKNQESQRAVAIESVEKAQKTAERKAEEEKGAAPVCSIIRTLPANAMMNAIKDVIEDLFVVS